ncbi:hypothetical protein OF83DRAFT_1033997, partial [Amylostereum chailletii]
IQAMQRIRNGGLLIEFNSTEAAAWIRTPDTRKAFASALAPTAIMKDRNYTVIVPFVPITFDIADSSLLCDIEGNTGIELQSISKAAWIKP